MQNASSNVVFTYKDLIVWKKAMDLVTHIYRITREFPREELYGLVSQMRRAAVSIPCNIAEGRRRGTKMDFMQFLRISYGSGSELETQIELCKRISPMKELDYKEAESLLNEVMRMLHVMLKNMS